MKLSTKRLQIDQSKSKLLATVAVATVLTVFFLVSTKLLLSQASHQKRLIDTRRDAVKQLQENVESANSLIEYYDTVFEGSSPTNIIGGSRDPSPNSIPPNGSNSRVVLNALPSSYDFPALITSVAKILRDNGIREPNITGTDESDTLTGDSNSSPTPKEVKLIVSGANSYPAIQRLIKDFERSIRPFDVTNMQLRGSESQMFVTLNATTYFQPAKSLTIEQKEVK